MPVCARASPLNSLSTPAIMRNSVDLPEPFRPRTPILAPGKNDREMSLRISRLGGTIFPTRCMVYTNCDIGKAISSKGFKCGRFYHVGCRKGSGAAEAVQMLHKPDYWLDFPGAHGPDIM